MTRMALEFEGRRVLDSELILSESGEHSERSYDQVRTTPPVHLNPSQTGKPSVGSSSHVTSLSTSVSFLNATPETQMLMASEMGIDGILQSEMRVGHRQNVSDQRTIEVHVSLWRVFDGQSAMGEVWASHCSAETGVYNDLEQAIDTATRCALESVGYLSDQKRQSR